LLRTKNGYLPTTVARKQLGKNRYRIEGPMIWVSVHMASKQGLGTNDIPDPGKYSGAKAPRLTNLNLPMAIGVVVITAV